MLVKSCDQSNRLNETVEPSCSVPGALLPPGHPPPSHSPRRDTCPLIKDSALEFRFLYHEPTHPDGELVHRKVTSSPLPPPHFWGFTNGFLLPFYTPGSIETVKNVPSLRKQQDITDRNLESLILRSSYRGPNVLTIAPKITLAKFPYNWDKFHRV